MLFALFFLLRDGDTAGQLIGGCCPSMKRARTADHTRTTW